MKILAFAGSNSSTSINKELLKTVLQNFNNEDIKLIDLNDFEMPLFSVDKEKNGFPSQAHQFLKEIENCDAIICSLAEHNRNFTVAFKNVFDWASRINVKVFQNKSMLLLTTSPGKFGGGNVMNIAKNTFPQFGADIKATFSLPSFYENFDMNKGVVNEIYSKELDMAISVFKSSI